VGPHPGDQFWIDGLPQQALMFGFAPAEPFTPTRWLHDGDTVQVGQQHAGRAPLPGPHAGPCGVSQRRGRRAFVGDVLFAGSIGRTDFPQGDHRHLLASIRSQLWPLGDDTVFIPATARKQLRPRAAHNPFVRDR
jgi:hydroxyacylglutathione hydrolase